MDNKINNIHALVIGDRRLKVREIANEVNILTERVCNILHERLNMKKLFARWVPRLLNANQIRTRIKNSEEFLASSNVIQGNFSVFRYVTVDQTWIHHYAPETKKTIKPMDFSR